MIHVGWIPDGAVRSDSELHIFAAEAHFRASLVVGKQAVRRVDESCYGQLVLRII